MAGWSRDTFVIVRQLLQWNCRPGNDGRAPHDKLSPNSSQHDLFFVTIAAAASMDQIALTWLHKGPISQRPPIRPVLASLCLRHSFLHDCPRRLATPEWLFVFWKIAQSLYSVAFLGIKYKALNFDVSIEDIDKGTIFDRRLMTRPI